MKRKRKLMIAFASVFVFLATSAGAFWAYVGDYYHADMEAIQSYGIHLFGRKMQFNNIYSVEKCNPKRK